MSNENNLTLISSTGVTQNGRLSKALLPEYIKIDERKTSDLLAFSSRYAEYINFYNIDNAKAGTWTNFFKNDISVFLSSIISTNVKRIEQEQNRLLHKVNFASRAEDKIDALEGLYTQVLEIADYLNSWYAQALDMNRLNPLDSNELEDELEVAIKQQLSENLLTLLDEQEYLQFNRMGKYTTPSIIDRFHPIWGLQSDKSLRALDPDDDHIDDHIKHYTKQARMFYRVFYGVFSFIIQMAPSYLEKSLTEKDDHRPDMALFITFTKLFQHNQKQLNTLTEKHLDFYYYDVLKMRERGLTPDQVNISLSLARHIDSYFLKKGTLLEAGRDASGQTIHYATDYDIVLNQGKIKSLQTLYVSKNTKISEGIGSSYRIITNLYASKIANSKDGEGEPFINGVEDWPTFGEEILDKPEYERQMGFGDIGWAVAAPILEMSEGHRTVTMRMEFDRASMYTLNLLIKDITKNQERDGDKMSREDIFSKIFRNSITVQFTTAEGWTYANTCEVLPPDDWNQSELTIATTLETTAPSVVSYNPEIHGEGFEAKAPVVKFLHKNIDTIFSYSFLKELLLEKVHIEVAVQGIKNLALSSDAGALDASMPFQPFGPVPKKGSYLIIGKAELFKKDLKSLNFNMEWQNLPDHKKGLTGHYREYGLGIKNEDFKIRMSALSGGNFYPIADEEGNIDDSRQLFFEHTDRPGLIKKTILDDFDIKAFNIKPDYDFELPAAFSNQVNTGYFKMELVNPKQGFAHDEYTKVYTDVVMHNANPKSKQQKIAPKTPFTPVLKSLTVDYTASTRVDVISIGSMRNDNNAVEQLYHIHPFGVIKTFDKGQMLNRSLVPDYDSDAYLFIGLENFKPPSTLSVYFELRENQDLFSFDQPSTHPEVTWSYLAKDEWKAFSQTSILSDTTYGFNNSGIVTLDVNHEATRDNKILAGGLHWFRVAVKGDANRMPRAMKVVTQALSATWVNEGHGDAHLIQPLEPNKIKRLASSVTEIKGVEQPFASFGGRPGENKNAFYTRVSERLRHKNRAVSTWDYERLVLEQFPFIYQVKCVTSLGSDKLDPGDVTIVVVPRLTEVGKYHLPRVNYTVLQSIKEYLQPLASPFVRIKVRNPVYERLKITAGVRFEKGKNNGTFLKKLNHDLLGYIAPWTMGHDIELDLGGALTKDVILSFIEKLPYVEHATGFSVVQVFAEEGGFDVDDTAISSSSSPIVVATQPWSVMIPFETNPIYLLDEKRYEPADKASISSMMINGDFVMTEEKEEDIDFSDYDE